MALLPTAIDDIVNKTLRLHEGRAGRKWTDLSLEFQSYVGMGSLVTGKKVKRSGGDQISFKVQTSNTGNYRRVGMYDVDDTKVDDTMKDALVQWRCQKTTFAGDVRAKEVNRGTAEMV